MPSISVEIQGLDEMKKAFNKSPALFVTIFDKDVKKATYVLLGTSRQWTPVDTDFLRGTMTTTFEALTGVIDSKAPYDIYVHEGTKKMEARPFYDQGIETGQADVDQIFEDALNEFNQNL